MGSAETAYQIIKKKIEQGCRFIARGNAYAEEMKQEVASAIDAAVIVERTRCAAVARVMGDGVIGQHTSAFDLAHAIAKKIEA